MPSYRGLGEILSMCIMIIRSSLSRKANEFTIEGACDFAYTCIYSKIQTWQIYEKFLYTMKKETFSISNQFKSFESSAK